MGSRLCEATCEATCSRCRHCTGAPSPDGKHPTAPPSHPPRPPSHPQGALCGLNRQARFVTLCTILGELGGETQVHHHLRTTFTATSSSSHVFKTPFCHALLFKWFLFMVVRFSLDTRVPFLDPKQGPISRDILMGPSRAMCLGGTSYIP